MLPKARRGAPLLALAPLVLAASLASVADGSLGARASIAGSPPIDSVSLVYTGSKKEYVHADGRLDYRFQANVRLCAENVQVVVVVARYLFVGLVAITLSRYHRRKSRQY